MTKATACRRQMPFGEHRTMAAVRETEELQCLRDQQALHGGLVRRLDALLSRAVMPWLDETSGPPSAA